MIELGCRMLRDGLTDGTGGNLSFYDPEADEVTITPSGIPYDQICAEDLVVMDLQGRVVRGSRVPSSEWRMHTELYAARPELRAVIHAHSCYATVLATLREGLPASHYLIAGAGPDLRCAEYATYGTAELADHAVRAMEGRRACLLANHGILVGHEDLGRCYSLLADLEYCCRNHVLARSIGTPVLLSEEEMARVAEKFRGHGQKK